MLNSSLIPISFRESPARLSGILAAVVRLGTRRVILVHVSSGPGVDRSRARLDAVASGLKSELGESALSLEVHVVSGSAAAEITRCAREFAVDYIAIPWKRKNWLQRTLVGSTTKDVIRLSDTPIFIHKSRWFSTGSGPDVGQPLNVLYATALKDRDESILPYLTWEGLQVKRLVLIHVGTRAPDPETEHRRDRIVLEALQELAAQIDRESQPDRDDDAGARIAPPAVTPLSLTGNPRRKIPQIARQEQIDVLILGKSEKKSALEGVLGSTAESVAYNTSQSVFVVGRHGADVPGSHRDAQ